MTDSAPRHRSRDPEGQYQGFSLSSVCWGYRDIFAQNLEQLFEQDMIGRERPQVTDAFFAFMRCAEQQHFDYVLKEFLAALNPKTAWLLALPGIFSEVTEMGRELAESKLHYGITYFRTLGEGGFGDKPEDVRQLISTLKRLRTVDDELAMALLGGYRELVTRLEPTEIDVYVEQGVRAFHQNRRTGLRFMEGSLKTSDLIIRSLTQEARLRDMEPMIANLLQALVGYEVEIGDLSRLDSDELIERGTRMVCMARWLYLPGRVRHFDKVWQNRNWYRLNAVVAAGMLAFDSFSRLQGHPAYATCADLVGNAMLTLNLFQIIEYVRVLDVIRDSWPGARRLIEFGLDAEYRALPPYNGADTLFLAAVRSDGDHNTAVSAVLDIARTSVNAFDTAAMLTDAVMRRIAEVYPNVAQAPLRTFGFLPDFLYPGESSQPPRDSLIADMKEQAKKRQQRDQDADEKLSAQPSGDETDDVKKDQEGKAGSIAAAYLYDEWSHAEKDYYENYCHVYERHLEDAPIRDLPGEITTLAQRTRRVFELMRPELTKEKHLQEGDAINVDLLTDYLIQRKRMPSPKVDFYEKPYHNRRDLATLILLDVSGSTGSEVERHKTIEIEKRAALILGQGLSTLDDRFSICGFSGNGREQCEFFVFKDFEADWDRRSIGRVMAAYPRSATRIGAALRHAGFRLSEIPAKQRLILLITDGKPMDTGYDPKTRYAQYDVRMACEENKRRAITTFCITTDENTRADMEIMFPDHRYAILPDVRRLPRILPRLYIRLTA
jgi:nitric oxide reductase activation protein